MRHCAGGERLSPPSNQAGCQLLDGVFLPKAVSRSAQADSHRRQASPQIRQCSCMLAWLSHSAAQLAQATRQASSRDVVMFAS